MSPHAHHAVYSLPPEGAQVSLGSGPAADLIMHPHAHHAVYTMPPEGAQVSLGAPRRLT